MSNNLRLNIDITSTSASASLVGRNEVSYSVKCSNPSDSGQQISCPFTSNPNKQQLKTVYNIGPPAPGIDFSGYNTYIELSHQSFNTIVPANVFNFVNITTDQTFALDVAASWQLNGNTIAPPSINSPQFAEPKDLTMNVGGRTCFNMDLKDYIYKLSLTYSTNNYLSPASSQDDINAIVQKITGNTAVTSYGSSITLYVTYVWTLSTKISTYACEGGSNSDSSPTSSQVNKAYQRYGIVTDYTTGQNSMGVYGFSKIQSAAVFNYDQIDKYKQLIKADNCFKMLIFIPVPIIFIFPLWIDVSLVSQITSTLTSALNQAVDTFQTAVSAVEDAATQVSFKNAVAIAARGEAVAKLVASGKANNILLEAAKNYAEKQLNVIQTARNYEKMLLSLNTMQQIIDKGNELINTLSAMDAVLNILNGQGSTSENTARALLTAIITANNAIDTAFKDFADLVDKVPDSIVKQKAQDVIRAIVDYLQWLDHLAKEQSTQIDKSNPVEVVIAVLLVLIDITSIKKFFHIADTLNVIQIAYDLAKQELQNNAAIKLASELDAEAAKQSKTESEQQAEAAANEAAGALDDLTNTVSDLLHVGQAVNLANQGLAAAESAVKSATQALNDAVGDVYNKKNIMIGGMLSQYLVDTLDMYKVSSLGKFDRNNPTERQLLINDIKGTRIYSKSGDLLYENKNFCNAPFNLLGKSVRLSSYGCDSSADPCGVGGFNCQQLYYWFNAVQYRVSFDFYGNQDLSKGGVVVGDFNGDGISDIWCHYPDVTKNYANITNNQIIYAPLLAESTNNRFTSKNITLGIKDWCKDGVVKAGDFNGDKKDDAFCVADSGFYLLYSNGDTFTPATNTDNGLITVSQLTASSRGFHSLATNTWSRTDVITTGDFDGDGFSDVLRLTDTAVDVLYGRANNSFVKRDQDTNAWAAAHSTQFAQCKKVGVNNIIIGDINNDGKDDIACVPTGGGTPTTINSIVVPVNNTSSEDNGISIVRLFVNDAYLFPIKSINDVKNSVNIQTQKHSNKFPADGLLITKEKMSLSQKTVSDVYIPIDCVKLGVNQTLESYFTIDTRYNIPANILWNQNEQSSGYRTIDIEASASMFGTGIVDLDSNPVQSFEYRLETFKGSCYKSQAITNLVSFIVNFNATVQMMIEKNGKALFGTELESVAKTVLSNFEATGGSTLSFPVEGHIKVNVLGVGYELIDNCN